MVASLDYPQLWDYIISNVNRAKQMSISDILNDVFPVRENPCNLSGMSHLHHVAVYLGDYIKSSEVFLWHDFLNAKYVAKEFVSLAFGPSYIAPKYYGTPGWWFSVCLNDGFAVEMFCCLRFGAWMDMPVNVRMNLMSHKAIAITSNNRVLELLNCFNLIQSVEIIAFTERDILGHTYGHLRNNVNNKVLELVYSSNFNQQED